MLLYVIVTLGLVVGVQSIHLEEVSDVDCSTEESCYTEGNSLVDTIAGIDNELLCQQLCQVILQHPEAKMFPKRTKDYQEGGIGQKPDFKTSPQMRNDCGFYTWFEQNTSLSSICFHFRKCDDPQTCTGEKTSFFALYQHSIFST